MPGFFSFSEIVFWKRILHSGQLKTDFLASVKDFVLISQIFFPLEVVFPSLGNIF